MTHGRMGVGDVRNALTRGYDLLAAGSNSSRTFLSARYDAPRWPEKCCAKIQPQSAATSTNQTPESRDEKGVLDRMVRRASGGEERVIRKTVEERDFSHDLESRALD